MASDFIVSKWYLDVIDSRTQNVTILYYGELKWKLLKIKFSNLLHFINKSETFSSASFSNRSEPYFVDNSRIALNDSKVIGEWSQLSNRLVETLFKNDYGEIKWECYMPISSVNLKLKNENQIYKGLGYVERLTFTIKPWEMPMKILRWGRFLSENQYVVWIRWEGETEQFIIFHNGIKHINGLITDEKLIFGTYTLLIREKSVIRSGFLSDTVFKHSDWLKSLLPKQMFYLDECKWQSKSLLYNKKDLIAEGWSIHEKVIWNSIESFGGKIAYAIFFILLFPYILIKCAQFTEHLVELPLPQLPYVGAFMSILGFVLMIYSMFLLWIYGDGLPMNAYPPEKFVTSGTYKLFAHPIYIGTSILSFGVSLFFESKSGFWLVSTLLTLMWLALLYGFEVPDLKKRFPNHKHTTYLSLPNNTYHFVSFKDVLSVYILVLLPWLLLYETVSFLGIPKYPISTYMYFERNIPVFEYTEIFYFLAYPFIIVLPFCLRKKRYIRNFMIEAWIMIFIGEILHFTLPFVAPFKPFTPNSILGDLLKLERDTDTPAAAFPSFHVAWAFLAARAYSMQWKSFNILFYIFALLISISCITTGMHSILDVLAGFLLFIIATRRTELLDSYRNYFEKLANSWHAWYIGPVRIINHFIYIAIAGFAFFTIIIGFIKSRTAFFFISYSSIIGSMLWAKFVESGSGLSRPFGYYGNVLGALFAMILSPYLFDVSFSQISFSYALASSPVQAIGRLRCTIQGCCHGKTTKNKLIGIRIYNEKSRVCHISKLKGKLIHVTQAYSIISNLIIGLFLWRLWYSDVSPVLISSLYCILNGLARFVEEEFRGEIQTPIYKKLKVYQWLAIFSILMGFVLMFLNFEKEVLIYEWKNDYFIPGVIFSMTIASAMSVDFPNSSSPFSRLASK